MLELLTQIAIVKAGTCLSGVMISFFWWLVGEVKHLVHLIQWNLNSCLCPCGLTWLRSRLGVMHDYLGKNWTHSNCWSPAQFDSVHNVPLAKLYSIMADTATCEPWASWDSNQDAKLWSWSISFLTSERDRGHSLIQIPVKPWSGREPSRAGSSESRPEIHSPKSPPSNQKSKGQGNGHTARTGSKAGHFTS